MSVARDVLRLTGPAVMTSFLQTLVFLTDRLLLGRYSEPALASMQVQGPIVWSVFSVFAGLTAGTIPLIARAVGARDAARASDVARAALRIALALGIGVCALGLVLAHPLVVAIGPASTELRMLSERYLGIVLLGFPQVFVATTAAMVLNGAGDTKTPFVIGLASNALHIAADLVLIFGVDLGPIGRIRSFGVSGAAAASVAAFTLEMLLLLAVLRRDDAPVRVTHLFGRTSPALVDARRALVRISAPSVLERIVIHLGYLAYAAVINRLGPLVMASNQALITLESICFLSADGFGIAAASVVGHALGRGEPDVARRSGWIATGLCVLALSTLGCVLWLTAPWTLGLFVPRGHPGTDLIAAGESAMPLLALAQPFMAGGIVLAQALRGAGDTRSPVVTAMLGGFAIRVGLVWLLGAAHGLGIRAVWIASGVDWIARTLILGVIFARGRWTRIVSDLVLVPVRVRRSVASSLALVQAR